MPATVGFISVRQHAEHGYFGGYLIVNQIARPLEFHCTLPVKPTRAHALLYGPTLDDFVCGEQIAKALVSKAKLVPDLVISDSPTVLAVAGVSNCNVVFLQDLTESTDSASLRLPMQTTVQMRSLKFRGHDFAYNQESPQAEQIAADVLSQLSERFDITEPFSRIVEALFEAHPIIKSAAA